MLQGYSPLKLFNQKAVMLDGCRAFEFNTLISF